MVSKCISNVLFLLYVQTTVLMYYLVVQLSVVKLFVRTVAQGVGNDLLGVSSV